MLQCGPNGKVDNLFRLFVSIHQARDMAAEDGLCLLAQDVKHNTEAKNQSRFASCSIPRLVACATTRVCRAVCCRHYSLC